jgi:hypothetical protein
MPSAKHTQMSKAEASRVLRRVGLPEETIGRILEELPDPIDFDRDSPILVRHGLTRDRLRDLMGGSP